MKKPILYFDMDNVLVDFQSGIDATPPEVLAKYADDGKGKPHYDDIPGIFQRMKPVEGATQAVKTLSELFDCYILSTSPWNNPTALNDKLVLATFVYERLNANAIGDFFSTFINRLDGVFSSDVDKIKNINKKGRFAYTHSYQHRHALDLMAT